MVLGCGAGRNDYNRHPIPRRYGQHSPLPQKPFDPPYSSLPIKGEDQRVQEILVNVPTEK